MSETKKRKVHTPELKAKVGLEAVRGMKTITEIAQAYGVHPQLVGQWKKEILESAGALFETSAVPSQPRTKAARTGCIARSAG
jgi:transposase-like protein